MRFNKIIVILQFIIVFIVLCSYIKPRFGGRLDFFIPFNIDNPEVLRVNLPGIIDEPLVKIKDGKVRSDIFESILWDDKESCLKFRLYAGLKWSDGKPISNLEVGSLLQQALSSSRFKDLEPIVIPLDGEIRLMIKSQPDFEIYYLLSRCYLKDTGGSRWSGPFIPLFKQGEGIILRSNINSPAGRPYPDEIRLLRIESSLMLSRIAASECGAGDIYISELRGDIEEFRELMMEKREDIFILIINSDTGVATRKRIIDIFSEQEMMKGITGNRGRSVDSLFKSGRQNNCSGEYGINSSQSVDDVEILRFAFPGSGIFNRLANRISALLDAAGYDVEKQPYLGFQLPDTERMKSDLYLCSLQLYDQNGTGEKTMLQFLNLFYGELGSDFFTDQGCDAEAIECLEEKLLKEYRILYLFGLTKARFSSCELTGGWNLSEIWLTGGD